MGDDLDGALSTALFLSFHPNARIIGMYQQYTQVIYSYLFDEEQLAKSIWLDLDVYHSRCRSLGHHIVRLTNNDRLPGLETSCNLNELTGTHFRNFRQKYPLGTTHFLMYLYQEEIPPIPDSDLLLWLADSSYINGQSKRRSHYGLSDGYRWNVSDWLQNHIPVDSLLETFELIDTIEFERRMQRFQNEVMLPRGFSPGRGQVGSRHLGLRGFQCQPVGNLSDFLTRMFRLISETTGWEVLDDNLADVKTWNRSLVGTRRNVQVRPVRNQGLDRFLSDQNVFSYAIQSNTTINFTNNMELP